MASTKKKKTTSTNRSSGTRSKSNSGKSSSGRNARQQAVQRRPIRRELGGVVCLVLALLTILGYFGVKGIFINWLTILIPGLIGAGYYITAVVFLVCAYILLFHHGRPVRLRVFCAALLPFFLGAFVALFKIPLTDVEITREFVIELWQTHGVINGLIAIGLANLISKIASGILFVVLTLFSVIFMIGLSLGDIADMIRNRPERVEYEPEEIVERPRKPVQQVPVQNKPRGVPFLGKRPQRKQIDIPFGDEEEQPDGAQTTKIFVDEKTPDATLADNPFAQGSARKGFFRKSEKKTPAEVLNDGKTAGVGVVAPIETAVKVSEPETVEEETPMTRLDDFEDDPIGIFRRRADVSLAEKTEEEKTVVLEPIPVETNSTATEPAELLPEIEQDPALKKVTAKEAAAAANEVSQQIAAKELNEEKEPEYVYPPINLLKQGRNSATGNMDGELAENQKRLDDTIHSFGIEARIVDRVCGPTVTRYELELDQGVRLNKLTNLSDDIALSLGASGVRIAPIPNKVSRVGIEVPNRSVTAVPIRDVVDSESFKGAKSKVSFAVGKDIGSNCVVGNIAKLPHLLIAGTTGSGKSVFINSLLLSILYKASPEEVSLIMVDPKMVELGIYNGIPHLLIPVVTDPKKAAGALQWAVTEMMKRYRIFSENHVRDLESYNEKAKSEGQKTMPQIVVVIDELADLMMVAAHEVEESICRVAQMGRAAGVHLVVATQRPSADVITGLMKANIPSRIAFAVASAMESRIILDNQGAEKLVGHGDMLYFPLGTGKPLRVQGCLTTDEEVSAVVGFIKGNSEANYSEEVMAEVEKNSAGKDKNAKNADSDNSNSANSDGDYDDLLPDAISIVVENGQASVSMLQRRLKLGYSRAARLVDQMEEKGVVGPFEGSKPRQVLLTKEQWQEMQYKNGMVDIAPDEMQSEFVSETLESDNTLE